MGQADWAQKREDLRFSVTLSVTAICGLTRCMGSFQKIPLTHKAKETAHGGLAVGMHRSSHDVWMPA